MNARKHWRIVLALVGIVILSACARQAALEQEKNRVELNLERTGVKDFSVSEKALTQGLPSSAPSTVPLFTGIDPASVRVDTTRPSNYFYPVNAPFGEVKQFFQKKMPTAKMHVNGVSSVMFDLTEDNARTTVFVSTDKPSIYPATTTSGTTYVEVTYNQKPLPTAEEILK